jgi:hypothetical protein
MFEKVFADIGARGIGYSKPVAVAVYDNTRNPGHEMYELCQELISLLI